MTFPRWVRGHLDIEAATRIEEAVAAVEKSTACELVPMVVLRSSAVDHVPRLLLCFFLILFFAFDGTGYLRGPIQNTYAIVFIVVAGFALISALLGRLSFIQRLILSEDEMDRQVRHRAELEFYRAGLQDTRESIGILIFLSLVERKVVILADKAIAEKLPASTWDSAVHLILDNQKKNNLTVGLVAAIQYCGDLLSQYFPIKSSDVNELRNHLIIKE
jgi:putative membrane protein